MLGAVAGPPTRPPPTTSDCVLPVRAASYPGAQLQELGAWDVGKQLTFQVPPGTVGFSIVSQELDGSAPNDVTLTDPNQPSSPPVTIPNSVVPTDVLAPGTATKFFDDFVAVPDPAAALAYYGGFTPAQGAFTVPNTTPSLELVRTAGQLPPGTWSFTVNDFARECPSYAGCSVASGTGRYDLKVLTKPGPLASTGALDVELYLVLGPKAPGDPGTSSRTAAALVGDPQLARYVSDLATILGRAGVCLGTVTLHDVPDWAIQDYAQVNVDSTGPCDPLSQLFALAVDKNAVHLFMVDALVTSTLSGQFTLLGLDGSIPGPSGVPATVNSGAALLFEGFGQERSAGACTTGAFDLDACGTDFVAYVSAHEAGHWLGLYHTTEQDGSLFDPLTDTATCACSRCVPLTKRTSCGTSNASVTAASCQAKGATCGGGSNLMFWLLEPPYSQGTLSPQQGEVVRANPAIRSE